MSARGRKLKVVAKPEAPAAPPWDDVQENLRGVEVLQRSMVLAWKDADQDTGDTQQAFVIIADVIGQIAEHGKVL